MPETLMTFCRYLLIFTCCFIPGGTLLLSHSPLTAFLIPVIGLGWVFVISYFRLVITPEGFLLLLTGLFLIHLASTFFGLLLLRNRADFRKQSLLSRIGAYCLLMTVNGIVIISCHIYKDRWFGFAFYHIPSVSMSPTLQSGDVVLADTWHYLNRNPEPGEVVIIRKQRNSFIMAKRVTKVRNWEEQVQLFVEGDNAARSVDSRRFGWLNQTLLSGRVQFIWFSFQNRERLFQNIE